MVNDAAGMGLILDIAVTEYPGTPYPSSSSEYKSRLKEILNQANAQGHAISYLEPWNEPNGQGNETEVPAAHFANEGNVVCKESPKCTVIAGNVEDASSATKYLLTYRENLNFTPVYWGVHPYQSVEHREPKYYEYFLEGLPNKGMGDHVWFTEVAARRCTGTNENGEIGQAERAEWLVQTLMPLAKPEHVFYWEFLLKNRQQPLCSETDDALYVPSSDPNAPDAPRPAAAFIYDDFGVRGDTLGQQLSALQNLPLFLRRVFTQAASKTPNTILNTALVRNTVNSQVKAMPVQDPVESTVNLF